MTYRALGLGLLMLATAMPLATARAAAPAAGAAGTQAPGFFRWRLGAFEITAINDRTAMAPMDRVLHGAQPGEIAAAYARDFLPLPVETSHNQFLINTGTKLILVDTGDGQQTGPDGGRLTAALAAAGYRPDQVDIVLITHFHADHIGGLLRDGQRQFPNAVVRADRRELDHWLNPAAEAAASEGARGGFRIARTVFAPYLAAGQVKPFDGATEIAPGIRSIPAYGHTPGHSEYSVESGGQKLVLLGDALHAAPVQFADPKVTIAWDSDEAAARAVREKTFADAAQGGYWIAGAHLPFPGTGHLRAAGTGYVFVPINYTLNH
ncbi:MAG: MBL fold metallo-hydrolase [Janthinobacterium lividum]